MSVDVHTSAAGFEWSLPRTLFKIPNLQRIPRGFTVSADGQRFVAVVAAITDATIHDPAELDGVGEVERRYARGHHESRIPALIADAKAIAAEAQRTFGPLNREQLNWRVAPASGASRSASSTSSRSTARMLRSGG